MTNGCPSPFSGASSSRCLAFLLAEECWTKMSTWGSNWKRKVWSLEPSLLYSLCAMMLSRKWMSHWTSWKTRCSSVVLLLCGTTGKLEGKSLLQFFAHEDQDRISQQFATSEAPVQAMKVEMLDSDQNHVKVELLHARFQNHLKENCFLIGVRELQNVESFAPLPPLPPSPIPVPDSPCARRTSRRSRSSRTSRRSSSSSSSRASLTSEGDLQIWFDVDTLGILACSNDLEKLVKSLQLPKLKSILDISSSPSRESLKHDLQHLCDAYHTNSQDGCSLSLNIPGLGDVESHLHIQEKMLASLRLKGPPCMTNQEGAESPPNNQSTAHYSSRILSRSTGKVQVHQFQLEGAQ